MKVFKKKRFYIFITCILFFLILAILILKNDVLKIDSESYKIIKDNIINENLTNYVILITNLGGSIGLIMITIILTLIFKDKKISIGIVINLIIAFLLNIFLKGLFHRPRPQISNWIINEFGYSFPSGHSMISMAFYGFLIYIIYVYYEKKYWKWPLIIILSLIIIFIGISRIYLGVHYLSDVLGGFLISIAYLIVFVYFFNRYIKHKTQP